MKKSLKLLFLGLFTPLLCGVSFAFNPLENFNNTPYNVKNSVGSLTYNIKSGKTYCVYFSEPNNEWGSIYINSQRQTTYSCNSTYFMSNNNTIGLVCFTACSNVSNFDFPYQGYNSQNVNYRLYEFDTPISVGGSCPTGQSCIDEDYVGRLENEVEALSDDILECQSDYNTISGSYNTCLDTLNTRNGQVASLSGFLSTCQGSLSTCQGDLSSCSNGCDVMINQCQESLSGCNNNLSSMTNYADSLSSQLNECLANSPDPCEGTGCDEIASGINAVFSFFWERDDQMFSLPIANNVFLPRGYRAYIDSGVVAISEYEKTSYSIDDSSFNEINKSFYSLIYGFIFLSAVALFCYYLKKFISKSFIPKEKKG